MMRFKYTEILEEIELFTKQAADFLATATVKRVIPDWKKRLEAFKDCRKDWPTYDWELKEDNPIILNGSKHWDRRVDKFLWAELSSTWRIHRTRTGKKGRRGDEEFEVRDKASILVVFRAGGRQDGRERAHEEGDEVARWHFDMQKPGGPGCKWHLQVKQYWDGQEIPVPRHPTSLFTTIDVLEFVLLEINQDEWVKETSGTPGRREKFQRRRMTEYLKRMTSVVEESGAPLQAVRSENRDFDFSVPTR